MTHSERRKIGIIGPGKLGSSLAATLLGRSYDVATSSRNNSRLDWLRSRFPQATIVENYARVPESADTIFITTSDSAIQEVCSNLEWRPHHSVIHCSGALTLDVLDDAENAGASVAGFHPLQTFPFDAADHLLNGIAFAIDCNDDDLTAWLQNLADELESQTFSIQGETAHALYHASAVLACGLLAGLVGISAELWHAAGIERDRALKMLSPMIRSTAVAIADDGLPDAISGPYVRGDIETIRKHLVTTSEFNPDISRAYASLALAQLHIANEKGNLDQSSLDQIRRALTTHLETL